MLTRTKMCQCLVRKLMRTPQVYRRLINARVSASFVRRANYGAKNGSSRPNGASGFAEMNPQNKSITLLMLLAPEKPRVNWIMKTLGSTYGSTHELLWRFRAAVAAASIGTLAIPAQFGVLLIIQFILELTSRV